MEVKRDFEILHLSNYLILLEYSTSFEWRRVH